MRNEVRLVGFAGSDAYITRETNYTKAFVSIATTETYRDKEGIIEKTYWHPCVGWNQNALAMAMIKKGDKVLIDGKLTYWTKEVEGAQVTQASVLVEFIQIQNKVPTEDSQAPSEPDFSKKLPADDGKFRNKGVAQVPDNKLELEDDLPF